jgi:hypothetical protein
MSKKLRSRAAAAGGTITEEYDTTAVEMESVDRPAESEIAALAWSYWEARGFQGGSPEEDWYRAEAALKNRKDNDATDAAASD